MVDWSPLCLFGVLFQDGTTAVKDHPERHTKLEIPRLVMISVWILSFQGKPETRGLCWYVNLSLSSSFFWNISGNRNGESCWELFSCTSQNGLQAFTVTFLELPILPVKYSYSIYYMYITVKYRDITGILQLYYSKWQLYYRYTTDILQLYCRYIACILQ